MDEVKLNLLLIGTTGQGKSSTGSKLLGRKGVFKVASKTVSVTKEANFGFTRFEDKQILVVDGPGMADTELTVVEDRETIAKNMSAALAMCYGGVDAFLFVTKFGNRFTPQETAAVEDIKKILGGNFMEHMIVVVTCGDQFWSTMEEEESDISFEQWCEEQEGTFRKLYKDCEGRVVLFNNREKDEERNRAEIRQVVQIAESLKKRHDRYTSTCFQIAEYEREKLILTHKVPELSKEIQEKVGLLTADIEDLLRNPSEEAKTRIRASVKKLKQEIEKYDKGYGILEKLLASAKEVERNLEDTAELCKTVKEIETTRQSQAGWGILGSVCTVLGGALTLVVPPVGLVAAGTAAVLTGITELSLQSNVNELKQKKDTLEKTLKK